MRKIEESHKNRETLKYKLSIEGKTPREIGKEFNRCYSTIYYWIKKHDLEMYIPKPKSIVETHPHLMNEWDFTENEKNDLHPQSITYGSHQKVSWKCSMCNYKWKTRVEKRTRAKNPTGCINCSGKVVNEKNSLIVIRPDIAAQWDYSKNNESPEEYHHFSNKSVHWLCQKCGHKWKARICNRVRRDDNSCRRCSGWLLTEENNLAGRFPEIAKLWDYEKNYPETPEDVFGKSSKNYYWICENGHSTMSIVSNKVKGLPCRECTKGERTSFPEKAVYFYIRKALPDAISEYYIGNRISFDVFIPKLKIAIEYDGWYWHKDDDVGEIDARKDKIAKDNDITLIRMRERKLDALSTSLCLENVDDNLDESIRKVMHMISTLRDSNLTKEEKKKLKEVKINSEEDFVEIGKQMVFSYVEKNITKTHPEFMKFWDYDKNKHLLPEQVSYGSYKRAHWKCSKGHEWILKVNYMVTRKAKYCLICKKENKNNNRNGD